MQIIGHRGARGEAPENTLGGFNYLRDLGIGAVEFDVRQLTDGQLVVVHDDNVLRTAGQDLSLLQHDYQYFSAINQAQQFSALQSEAEKWAHEPLPLLSQVFDILKDFEHIEVEVKTVVDAAAAERLIDSLLPLIAPLKNTVTVTSFDLKILQALQAYPMVKRGLLIEFPFGVHAIDTAEQLGCCRIGWKDALATEALIQQTHNAGLAVSVWTVNDPARAIQLRDWGIDGLITDVPRLMQQSL